MQIILEPVEVVMVQDLFAEPKSKKEQLFDWIKSMRRVKTSEVCEWGVKNYSPDRASRNARELRDEGKIYRLRQDLKDIWYPELGESVYTIYEFEGEKELTPDTDMIK